MRDDRARARRWVSADELRAVLDLGLLMEALRAGHAGPRAELADGLIGPASGRYLIRSASLPDGAIGSKLITIFPDNPKRHDKAAVQALMILFDASDGSPLAVMDATELTYWKTAADSGLGAKLLAREDSRRLLVVGAGGLAPWLVRGHLAARPGLQVQVWNRTRERAEALVARFQGEGVAATTAPDLETAVAAADIITTCTMAREPILKGSWLRPGVHVDLVGSYSNDTRESDDAVVQLGRLFVDARESAFHGVGDIVQPLRSGAIKENDVLGDLYDLIGGNLKGRSSTDDITVYKNAGGAHLDLMVATALLARLS